MKAIILGGHGSVIREHTVIVGTVVTMLKGAGSSVLTIRKIGTIGKS